MKALTKEQEVIRQVDLAKKSLFGVTAIKIEMEGVFQRSYTSRTRRACDKCNSSGYVTHAKCDGRGYTGTRPDYYGFGSEPDTSKLCLGCNVRGSQVCPDCFDHIKDWNNTTYCQQWLLRQVHGLGLSIRKRDGSYEPAGALKFAYFYNDPSVDSEFTFTLSLKNSEDIFLLPQVVALWKQLGTAIGRGLSIDNAGMHMAFLRSKDCVYPTDTLPGDNIRLINMEKSMRMLMPALFFLGSDNKHSRGMRFRIPRVSTEKYSAIHFGGSALEFRVFETCYDNPERVIDNFIVMRNCIRFWSDKYRDPNLKRIAQQIKFGNDSNSNVNRFYSTVTHLELLNAGLTKIKPAYYTLKELKDQRGFDIDKRTFTKRLNEVKQKAAGTYKGYRDQQLWKAERARLLNQLDTVDRHRAPASEEERLEIMTEAERISQQALARARGEILDETHYIEREVENHNNNSGGQYTLSAA